MNSDNIFFDISKLKKCGKNVIIGKTVRIRYPELVEIGDNVILDDFIYISTNLKLGNNIHIASGCKFIGGKTTFIEIDDYSTLAPNVVLSAGSDNYTSGIGSILLPEDIEADTIQGEIKIRKYCILGASCVVLPDVTMEQGSAIGALSLVKNDIKAWQLHAGIPAKKIKNRDKDKIAETIEKLKGKL